MMAGWVKMAKEVLLTEWKHFLALYLLSGSTGEDATENQGNVEEATIPIGKRRRWRSLG